VEKQRLRDEVAKLSDAVQGLRDDLAGERAARLAHYCQASACHCGRVAFGPSGNWPVIYYPNTWQQPVTHYAAGCAGSGITTYVVNTTACPDPVATVNAVARTAALRASSAASC
jgi:hypothetical protein